MSLTSEAFAAFSCLWKAMLRSAARSQLNYEQGDVGEMANTMPSDSI